MKIIDPREVSTADFHAILLGAVAPRPIAFVSTIDGEGNINLSPFSFFNIFGSNPPLAIFSPARRVRGNTEKDTLVNVREVPECVINIVNYAMVEQTSLASTEYARGVNEFVKAGFTQIPSERVRAPRVGEAPVAFECEVTQIIETGTEGGAGNLVLCEIVLAHVREDILNENGKIDPHKIDLVGRAGGDWYVRAQGEALFEVAKPLAQKGIGVDALPAPIRNSKILTGNDLGKLGNVESIPTLEAAIDWARSTGISASDAQSEAHWHTLAQSYLLHNRVQEAWLTLLYGTSLTNI